MNKISQFQNSSKKPLISIVTPAYNEEQFISDNLESVKEQTYPNIEHIVVDDGSTDNTPQILEEYENKYNLKWVSKPNEGQVPSLNKGFQMANGQLIGWLNADDVFFDKNVISDVVHRFLSLPSIGVLFGNLALIDKENRIFRLRTPSPLLNRPFLLHYYRIGLLFFKKEIVKNYRFNEEYDYFMDREYCLKLFEKDVQFGRIDRILGGHRIHSQAKSSKEGEYRNLEKEKLEMNYLPKSIHNKVTPFFKILALAVRLFNLKKLRNLYSSISNRSLAFHAKFPSSYLETVKEHLCKFSNEKP